MHNVYWIITTERRLSCVGGKRCLMSERPGGEWSAWLSGLFALGEYCVPIEHALIGPQHRLSWEREEFQCWYRESNSGRWVSSHVTDRVMTVCGLVLWVVHVAWLVTAGSDVCVVNCCSWYYCLLFIKNFTIFLYESTTIFIYLT